jgi:hypothetical protein
VSAASGIADDILYLRGLGSGAVICSHDHIGHVRDPLGEILETNLVLFRVYNEPICSTSTR